MGFLTLWHFNRSKAVLHFWIMFRVNFVMLHCLFNGALWSPAGKALTSWLSCMWSFVVFCHFPLWCPVSDVVLDCVDS